MTWLITGGAGYIGGHTVRELHEHNLGAVVMDDLSTGRSDRVPDGVPLVVGSVLDTNLVIQTIDRFAIDGVVHIAAKKQVAESVAQPLRYYRENVEGLRSVLSAMETRGVRRLVFSSSAAVYGEPTVDSVDESYECHPVNPYGATKLVGEWMINSLSSSLDFVILRYFNVAGAADTLLRDDGATNLIPMALNRLATGRTPVIFGDDYPTSDGTCVRDFVDVRDVASAHLSAATRLHGDRPANLTLNIGRGEGSSVREVMLATMRATGLTSTQIEISPRRTGDPARVVASVEAAAAELNWRARYGVSDMVTSAWETRPDRVQRTPQPPMALISPSR